MTTSELQQAVNQARFLGNAEELAGTGLKAASETLAAAFSKYLPTGNAEAPAFGVSALNETLDAVAAFHTAYKNAAADHASLPGMGSMKDGIAEMEKLLASVDPTKGQTLEKQIDDLQPKVVSLEQAAGTAGNASNSRHMLSVPRSGAANAAGFFTEENRLFEAPQKLTATFETCLKNYPEDAELQAFGERVRNSRGGILSVIHALDMVAPGEYYAEMNFGESLESIYKETNAKTAGLIGPDENLDVLKRNPNICNLLKECILSQADDICNGVIPEAKAVRTQRAQYSACESGIQAVAGSSVSGRNVAMSRIANLLGVPGLLARSSMMTVSDENGTMKKGVFMETAVGHDLPDKPRIIAHTVFAALPKDTWYDGAGLRSVADLQIVDYICQNADRHARNMLYTFDENKKLVSVQGIDNDLSFGTVDLPDDASVQKTAALNRLKAVSSSMKQAVMRMTPDMMRTALSDTGLKEAEIEAACGRLTRLQNALANSHVRETGEAFRDGVILEVPDGKWNDVKLAEVASDSPTVRNIFSEIKAGNNMINEARTMREELVASGKIKPDEFKETAMTGYTDAGDMSLIGESGMNSIRDKFRAIDKDLAATTGLFKRHGKEFDSMRKALKEILTNENASPEEFSRLMKNVRDAAADYVTYKAPRGDKGRTAETRLELASKLVKTVDNLMEPFTDALHAAQEAELDRYAKQAVSDRNKMEIIAETIVDHMCRVNPALKRSDAEAALGSGEAFTQMINEKNGLDTYSRMARENPDAFIRKYTEMLSNVYRRNGEQKAPENAPAPEKQKPVKGAKIG